MTVSKSAEANPFMHTQQNNSFERLVFPVLDRLNGTHIRKILQYLRQTERWSFSELRELQRRKLQNLLLHTRNHVAPYVEHWRKSGIQNAPDSEFELLRGIPLISKEDLRKVQSRFPLPGWKGKVVRSKTSGSTGEPMTFARSIEQESWFWALRFRIWEWAGYRMGDPYLTINLNPRLAWKKRIQDRLFRCTYLTYNADNLDSGRILQRLESEHILHLNGFSSSLYSLARYMEEHGIANPGIRSVTATGDMLFPHYREVIERQFGVRVIDYYGAGGEGLHVASQCDLARGYHIHMENTIVEVLAGDRLARPGELGRLVVTQLDNYAMPLIRYDIGDTAILDTEPCACGRAHPTLKAVNGRVYDIVYAPNGSALLPHFFVVAFKNLQQVRHFQAIQSEPGRIVIKLVAGVDCNRAACERELARAVAQATAGSLLVEFDWVSEIPLVGAGKRRVVISRIRRVAADPSGSSLRPIISADVPSQSSVSV
jgi:phenylacetate-CoA ligase